MNRTEHLLVVLMEEAAEVQQAASKALRFGLHDCHDYNTTGGRLYSEVNDLAGVITMLKNAGVPIYADAALQAAKIEKVEHYLKVAEHNGTLQNP